MATQHLLDTLTELRELRHELEEQRWRNTAALQRLWAGERLKKDAHALSQPELLRKIAALKRAEALFEYVLNGPRLEEP